MDLNTVADFTWLWNDEFFLETISEGNFIWSDPDYGGSNEIRPTDLTLAEYCKDSGMPYGRGKGKHFVELYCGKDVTFCK